MHRRDQMFRCPIIRCPMGPDPTPVGPAFRTRGLIVPHRTVPPYSAVRIFSLHLFALRSHADGMSIPPHRDRSLDRRRFVVSTGGVLVALGACDPEERTRGPGPDGGTDGTRTATGTVDAGALAPTDAGGGPDAGMARADASVAGMDAGGSVCVGTEPEVLGPAYLPGAPERRDLNANLLVGEVMEIEGVVQGPACQPLPGAWLEVWHASPRGEYDGSPLDPDGDPAPHPNWPFRGRVTTRDGRYRFRTLRPGLYPGRTRHIHVIAQAPGHHALTTQMYFEGEPENAGDSFFHDSLAMTLERVDMVPPEDTWLAGRFDFTLLPL